MGYLTKAQRYDKGLDKKVRFCDWKVLWWGAVNSSLDKDEGGKRKEKEKQEGGNERVLWAHRKWVSS